MTRVLLMGDVMLGRGIQLTFPYQTNNEEWIRDTMPGSYYLIKAMHHEAYDLTVIRANHIYLLDQLKKNGFEIHDIDAAVMNIETSITNSITERDVPLKGINYHMNIQNLALVYSKFEELFNCPVILSFSNNHVMDFGRISFERDNLPINDQYAFMGMGKTLKECIAPRIVKNLELYAVTTECSGTPSDWKPGFNKAGIFVLPSLSSMDNIYCAINFLKSFIKDKQSRTRILSIHFGPNWALKDDGQIFRAQFARKCIDELGFDLIFGHSSHHVRGLELYKKKLILYGAGDLINDYEGFQNKGEEGYFSHFGALHLVNLEENGDFKSIKLLPSVMFKLQLYLARISTVFYDHRTASVVEIDRNELESFLKFINEMSRNDSINGQAITLGLKMSDTIVNPPCPTFCYP